MSTSTATATVSTSGAARTAALAWGATLAGSALPLIVWQELAGAPAPLALRLAQVGVMVALLLLARRSPAYSWMEPLLRWLVALSAGWHLVVAGVRSLPAWELWQHSVPWAVRSAAVQGLLLVPTVLLLLLGVGLRSRRELRLRWGEASAPARPDLFTLGTHTSWRWLGPLWTIPLCVGTFTAMLLAIPPDAAGLARLLTLIPAICIIAALNTVSEEFHFRNVPLAFLPGLLGPRQALLLTGVYFGLEHFYGNPPGLSGVLLASFIGYWMGKSMLETEGSGWAWLIHWLQDVIIFSFVAMSWK